MNVDVDVAIVGAGAAGLWAAATAARVGRGVVVVEKTPRAGTKILASGGTRCNLTTTLGPTQAARLFGPAEAFLGPALRALPPDAVRRRFAALGVPTVEEPALEKVFPASQRAVDVRDALVADAVRAGATFLYSRPVLGIARLTDGGWGLDTRAGPIRARTLLVCAGGRSYPRAGTTGDAYAWLAALGLAITPPVPALVPLTSDAGWVTALSGVSLQRTEARLVDADNRVLGRRARPVLFTHHGLSGPGAMDLSVHLARARHDGGGVGWSIALDLVPGHDLDAVRAALVDAAMRKGGPHLARVLDGFANGRAHADGSRESVPTRLVAAATRQAGLEDDNPPLHRVDRRARNRLADALKGLRVPVDGTLGWDHAEVTAGGLALSEVDPRTLEVHRCPGLHVFGELLDLTGPIGGLNFQAAFATAELAGRALAGGARLSG